jgi:class 3 adenylate cyclase
MAYVLFTDLVGYSILPMDRQAETIQLLQEIVRATPEFQRAQASEQLICLPTGDGMALVFFQNPVSAVQCATEIARSLRNHPELRLRMGVHTGPVHRIADINTSRNVSGGGINLAQRVMDCGDAGHILVSKTVADILGQLSRWSECLHDLGEHEVKHGVKVHLVNLHTTEVGNPEIPEKLRQKVVIPAHVGPPAKSRRGIYMLAGSALTLVILFFVGTQVANWWRASAGGAASRTEVAATQEKAPETGAPGSVESGAAAAQQDGTAVPAGQGTGSAAQPSQAVSSSDGPTAGDQAAKVQSAQPTGSGSLKKSLVSSGQSGVAETPQQLAQVQGTPPGETSPGPFVSTAATSTASSQPATPGASDAELEALEDRLLKLSARANATKGGVDRLRQQQARLGVGLRADMATALDRQEYLLGQAEAAFNAGDATRAKRQLDLAEREVEKLERFLGM